MTAFAAQPTLPVSSFDWDGAETCQLVERQFRFALGQFIAHDHVLPAKLAPESIR
jgi:hypothetical protein